MSSASGVSERRRVLLSGFVGLAVAAGAALVVRGEGAVLAGWIAATVTLMARVWTDIWRRDAAATQILTAREDDSRTAAGAMLVGASGCSLVAVGFGLHAAADAPRGTAVALTAAAMAAVGLAWITVHTTFTLRYAHEYYADEPGGIDFPGGHPPAYSDFAYFAFTIGMTFQVSDTAVTSRSIRRTVLRHALWSYLFGTAIIASSIGVLAGFVV